MADYGEAKAAPETLSMLLGKYLGEGAEAVGSIFPQSNPYGQAVKNLLLGDIPETASRLEEGEPYVLMDTRAGRQLIKPEALEVAGFLPIGEVAKGVGVAAKGVPALGAIGAIKLPGGNWIQKDIDDSLNEIIWSSGLGHAKPLEEVLRLKNAPSEEQESVYRMLATRPNEAEREALFDKELSRSAIREWLETKFNKYIKNEMGTERDPLRQLAEKGVSMMRPLEGIERSSLQRFVPPTRQAMGFPREGYGQSDLAKDWELLTDVAITPRKSGELIGEQMGLKTAEELYPWLLKVPPETKTYSILEGQLPSSMGVEDFAKTLKKYVASPQIDPQARFAVEGIAPVQFPPELALKYSDLQKMNVPQVVERVAKMRDWEQQDIERKLLESTKKVMQENAKLHSPTFQLSFNKEPGGTWVEIPDTKDLSGKRACTALGKAGGWCTQEAQTAEDYGSGAKRLVNFLDSSGRPHIQIQTVESVFGPRIAEIKPVGNTFRSERAVEYAERDPEYHKKLTDELLNFLNEGNWGHVDNSSLYQFGIEDLASKAANGAQTYEQLKEQGVPRFIKKDLEEYAEGGAVQYDPDRVHALMTKVLAMKEGGDVEEPSLRDQAREKAAAAWEGLKQMYQDAKDRNAFESVVRRKARGGAVDYDPDKIARLMAKVLE